MTIDVKNFDVQSVIVHDVPRHSDATADEAITFSDAPMTNMTVERRNFFKERINRSLLGRAYQVEPDPDQPSVVPDLVAEILDQPTALVSISQQMARALYAAQNKVNNPGLLTVIIGKIGNMPCVSVLKLQRHEGMRMEPVTDANGRRTFDATILDDLTLTDDTKIFKASLFQMNDGGPVGLVSDDQRGEEARIAVATFFLSRFLGCRLTVAPDVATRAFYEASRRFISDQVPDPQRQLNYRSALTVALISPSTTIAPTDFADTYLETEDRQPYLTYLAELGVPEMAIDKNTDLIDRQLRRITVLTTKKIRIIGTPTVLDDVMSVDNGNADSPPRIIIHDSVEDTK